MQRLGCLCVCATSDNLRAVSRVSCPTPRARDAAALSAVSRMVRLGGVAVCEVVDAAGYSLWSGRVTGRDQADASDESRKGL